MSYVVEKQTGDVVIKGFENGISDDPYAGISDLRNVNLISIPKEASVNFSTSAISAPNANGTMTNSSASGDTVTLSTNVESGQAIQFSVLSDVSKGISLNTTYWAVGSGGVYQLYSDYPRASLVNISGDGLTGTWATINMGSPKYFSYATDSQKYWMVDATGYVWSNTNSTNNSPFYWTYTGNKINNFSNGNGLVYYRASDGTGYIFVFSNSSIDYTPSAASSVAWVYQWNIAAGTVGAYSATPTARLKTDVSLNNPHEAMVAPDNKVYFTDANWIDRWYQTDPTVAFVPTTLGTYTFDQTSVLPFTDTAQCLAVLGNNLLIGGKQNIVYPWDTFNNLPQYPILIPEFNVVKLVTVNTNTFIFVGNRGRIYITNGSQAQLYKKIPDHLSGTIEPYYTWGGACSNKNQLFFSASATTNAGVALTTYGGVWGIDLDSKAIRMTNTLSYQTTVYNGYATAIIPNFGTNPAGLGLYIGWNSGSSTYGIDTTSSTPYTGSQTVAVGIVDSDLIPIGTFLKPTTNGRVEFKLAVPLVSNESIQLYYRQAFSSAFTAINSGAVGNGLFNTAGDFSGACQNVDFQNSQWIQIRALTKSTGSSPSYVRLTELRLGN